MKTKTFLIPRVVQVPTGVKQIALQKWIALLKTLDFLFLAARFFCLPFWDPFLGGWTAVLKNIGLRSALFVFLGLFSLEVVGRVLARTFLGVVVLDLLELLVLTDENTLMAKLSFLSFLITMLRSSVLWVVDGSFLEASWLLALVVLLGTLVILVLMNENNLPAKLFLLVGPGLRLVLAALPIDLPGQDHVAGSAGRQGVEQPARGRGRVFAPDGGA